ncbi:hypothetical protein P153DRAFT_310850 [Dothidotthia symphoricarpi CBS 119687]|uniref:Uncharacterized protein n=1 Tax=Dothidotthia symphoricarpi CBS 119687 TaxID=1392245 RepID=A0A6A6AM48_9PLEO|nr:uncharacterized protein P153DRAFT_310850 [Dothidotthia symphoricarpi CBS 119687]KAF2132165.1 hypothetical protein P153DRAFT_310850 [Dothidotthia symphoricarpi CBS 119687]
MSKGRVIPLLALGLTATIVFFFYTSTSNLETWRGIPQQIGLGEHVGDIQTSESLDANYVNWNPKINFEPGSAMPAGHNWTSTLVIAKTKEEDINWIKEELPNQELAVYVVDDPSAPLHPPKNKGHEVMVYLSYIIDHYDNLPDVAIFMHAHQYSWHNDDLLGSNAKNYVERLSRQRVWREGYVNMRCNWNPGCPDWQHPGETTKDDAKQEEVVLAKSWSELFPLDEVPSVLAQPCCAQFALSRERIQAKPHAQYVWYREWLFSTKQPDDISGRVWEYVWQFVFTGQNVVCPKEHLCFCDQYGTCFGGEEQYNEFKALKSELDDRHRNLEEWETARTQEREQAHVEIDEEGMARDEEMREWFRKEIEQVRPMVEGLLRAAEERGRDPKLRAEEVGREWHEGDSY